MVQGPRPQKRSGEDGERLPLAGTRDLLSDSRPQSGSRGKNHGKIIVSSLLFLVYTL